MITLTQYPLIAELPNQASIDEKLISPQRGINIKLVDSANPERFYVGTVSDLISTIRNAYTGVFTAMVLDGVDSEGTQRTLTISVTDLLAGNYAGYDLMFYTANLNDPSGPIVLEQGTDSVVDNDRTVNIFDNTVVRVGSIIAFKLSDGNIFRGTITMADPNNISLRLISKVRTSMDVVALTLEQATAHDFQGAAIFPHFGEGQAVLWSDSNLWNDDDYWRE